MKRKTRKKRKEKQFKDMLDVLLDMHEDKNAEIKLDKKKIRGGLILLSCLEK